MPTASINLTPQNGNTSVVAINCGTSTPKLSGTINIAAYQNISSFICRNNDIERINSLATNPQLLSLRLEDNNLSKINLETLTTSISNNSSSIVSNSNKNINFSLTGVRMGKMDRLIRLNNVNKYEAQLDKQGFNIVYAVNGETDQTWNGSGIDNNLSTAANWINNESPLTYDALYFDGTTRLNVTNDLPVDTELNGITFNSGSGQFTLTGNRFVLTFDGINNNSTNTQIIRTDMVLSGSNRTINCNAGNIFLTRNIISGSASLTKLGAQTLTLSSSNTYTGGTYISAGVINVQANDALGTGSIYCSAGTGIVITTAAGPANTIINNPIAINGQRPNFGPNIFVQKSATFNSLITVGPDITTNRLTVGNNATMTINGGISGGPGFTGVLTMNGEGTFIIQDNPVRFDNAGATPIYSDTENETVIIAVPGNKFNNIYTGANLRTDVPFAINNDVIRLSFDVPTSPPLDRLRFGRINLNGNDQIFRNIINNTTNFRYASGSNIFNNSPTFAILSANNQSPSTYTGSISGNINLIKTGGSAFTLSGSTALRVGPRHTGFTAISAGTLINYALSSNPGDKVDFAQFTRTLLTVNFLTSPTINDKFILLPGRTINSYTGAVTLAGAAAGRQGTYNNTTSTLTVTN